MPFVLAVITDPLEQFCTEEDDRESWEDVPEAKWWWHANYSEEVASGNDVNPAGFKAYTLKEFNEPPICITVPGSGDKKVEILIQTMSEDAHVCIHDASDIGYANNDVGNVDTCGMGRLYACFTAAEAEDDTNTYEDFSFYVFCKESCESSDIGLWMRVRTSNQTWKVGKTGVADDLEMWCEMEKGTTLNDTGGNEHQYFTYPEDLIQDDPSSWPFVIEQVIDGIVEDSSGSGSNTTAIIIVAIFGILFLIIAGLCVCKNHDQLPESCQKLIPCSDGPIDDYE